MASFFKQLKRRWILFTILFIVLAAGGFFFKGQGRWIQGDRTYRVEEVLVQDELSLSGEIDAHEMAVLRFQTSGRLSWVGVKEGEWVEKYQGIASLDVRDVRNNMEQYLNTYASERHDFDQTADDNRRTMSEGTTPEARDRAKRLLEKAQFDLRSAVLDVELQKLALEYAYLYTPIDGIVVEASSPVAGVNITPAQAEFIVINPDTLYFSATADQTDVVKLREGMRGTMTFDSLPEEEFTGEITSVAFIPDEEETGTVYRVQVAVTPQSPAFRMKMTGDITFPVGEKRSAIRVPASAVTSEDDKEYVMVKVNGKKVKTQVTTGEIEGEMIEITSGLKKGDLVYDQT